MVKKTERPCIFICRVCGREISGDHVTVRRRGYPELHIHFSCIPHGKGAELR